MAFYQMRYFVVKIAMKKIAFWQLLCYTDIVRKNGVISNVDIDVRRNNNGKKMGISVYRR